MPLIVRDGDTSSHGGSVSGTSDLLVEGKKAAKNGDILNCPIHGVQTISASRNTIVNSQAIVVNGDSANCGATLQSGATKSVVN